MSNTIDPSTLGGKPVRFSVGYKEEYLDKISNGAIDDHSFYIVIDGDTCLLCLGSAVLSGNSDITIDNTLSTVSANPVQNKVVTEAIERAVEVIKDTGSIDTYIPGTFYYKEADTMSGQKASLKFYVSALESIDLTKVLEPISTYSATDSTNPITGKGVSAALETLKIYDVESTPENFIGGAFYRIYDEARGVYDLIYSPTATKDQIISFATLIPQDHSDLTNKYGAASATKYGHAKSGLEVTDNSDKLKDAYSESDKDKDLVGETVESFARVDHKHPYPSLDKLVSLTSDFEQIAKSILGNDVSTFISESETDAYLREEQVVVPATTRLQRIEDSYISSSKTESQTINSSLSITDTLTLTDTNKLVLKNIETPLENGTSTRSALTLNGKLDVTGTISAVGGTFTGKIIATNQAITAGSLELSSTLTAAGDVELGANGDGLTITNPKDSSDGGSAVFNYAISAPSASITGTVTASAFNGSLSGTVTSDEATFTDKVTTEAFEIDKNGDNVSFIVKTAMDLGSNGISSSGDASFANASFTGVETTTLELDSKTITIATGDRTTNTSNLSDSRLVVDGAYHLTEYDLRNSSGLIHSWLASFNYATNSSVQNIESKFVSTWNTEDNTKIPTQAAISNYMAGIYVPMSSIESTTLSANAADKIPSSKAVATFVNGLIETSVGNTNEKVPTSLAVSTYVTNSISNVRATSVGDSDDTMPTGKAVKTYVTGLLTSTVDSTTTSKAATPKAIYDYYGTMITVSNTQPAGNRAGQLWINTSMGNGVLYYYNGSAWKATSGVWS